MPACGFSKATIQVLGLQGVDPNKFTAFDVLEDIELRVGMSPSHQEIGFFSAIYCERFAMELGSKLGLGTFKRRD